MQLLFSLCLFLVSQFSFSQTPMAVLVTPKRPANCQIENHRLVNWIYNLKTISENTDEAVIQFTTQYGQCIDGKTIPAAIDPDWAVAYVVRNGAMPWQKNGVKTKLNAISDTELSVTLTFNKKFLFKKQSENHLSYYFQPSYSVRVSFVDLDGRRRPSQTLCVFPWNIDIYLEEASDHESLMSFQIH